MKKEESTVYQLTVLRKNNQTFVSVSPTPANEFYAMLYEIVRVVSKKTGQTVKDVLYALDDLDEYVEQTGQK